MAWIENRDKARRKRLAIDTLHMSRPYLQSLVENAGTLAQLLAEHFSGSQREDQLRSSAAQAVALAEESLRQVEQAIMRAREIDTREWVEDRGMEGMR